MAATLSEKAKGKLRAVDPTATDEPVSKALTIRFTEGIPKPNRALLLQRVVSCRWAVARKPTFGFAPEIAAR